MQPSGDVGWLAKIGLTLLLSLLVMDGFPAGIAVLREFGARPINFPLAVAGAFLVLTALPSWRRIYVRRDRIVLMVFIVLCVSALNLAIALFRSGPDSGDVLSTWIRQFLMLTWGAASYFIWRRLLIGVGARTYSVAISVAAVLPVVAFLVGYAVHSWPTSSALEFIRHKNDPRPSGFATEPSIYSAWISFTWPVVVFAYKSARSRAARIFSLLVLTSLGVSTFLSGARTGVVIFIVQVGYYGFWAVRQQPSFVRRARSFLGASLLLAVAVIVLWQRLITVTELQQNGSDVARFAYTLTGIRVALDHPWLGTGIGQFGYFFSSYLPDFALQSREVADYAYGLMSERVSTFNLFVRMAVEFGVPLALYFSWIILRPLIQAAKPLQSDPFRIWAALSAIGGVGFWLSQDQYGYQPAILALAVLSLSLIRCGAWRASLTDPQAFGR